MAADERSRYLRQSRRLRDSARRWSVLGGALAGAAAILTPYQGLGLPDAAWAAAAGGSVVLAAWRWADLRRHHAEPLPPAPDPAAIAAARQARLTAMIEQFPAGRTALQEFRRQRARAELKGSAAVDPWLRLDRASGTLTGLAPRLTGHGAEVLPEAADAERSLRDVAHRVAGVERALRFAPPDGRAGLEQAHRTLLGQLSDGVTAFEALVAAAAGYVAEDARAGAHLGDTGTADRLTQAADRLSGITDALTELRPAHPGS
ncbi:phage shock envelope stress response protein PspM [Catenuloplanes atrovinosus]|uniref:Uncharacterized protein n=1 Tax=Catenuloplanes atrovinosus TaxID=137266 RepID=A0AAE3YKC0_9ACTN|nr:hypothetical protein [Catenuloplanes atrovinosus]MDR7273426.1 hypothetical protein [Catenuloplanes atrovinosus]